jgi:hydroxyacylglutathione hydrolase
MPLKINRINCLRDNYVWLMRDSATGQTAVVDPAEFEPVRARLAQLDWKLDYILNTHHHSDHVGANLQLQDAYGCTIVGARHDIARIPGIVQYVEDGDRWHLGESAALVVDTPGHTVGHIVYWFEASNALFCGDTLFSMGCGRLFEGSAQQMWASLKKLRDLPDQTQVYCAHEYTQANVRFALHVDPSNKRLRERADEVGRLREQGLPTVPILMEVENKTNPFLRADSVPIARYFGMTPDSAVDVFAALRALKDNF